MVCDDGGGLGRGRADYGGRYDADRRRVYIDTRLDGVGSWWLCRLGGDGWRGSSWGRTGGVDGGALSSGVYQLSRGLGRFNGGQSECGRNGLLGYDPAQCTQP